MILARAQNWILPAIFILGAVVRIAGFGAIPGGLNQDEASLGYDAFSVLHYGVDRHGVPFPAFLIAWGSGMNALSAYLSIPFIAAFGLSPVSVRLVNLIAGLVSLPAFYLLACSVSDKRVAAWAAFLLSVSPWHIMMSRWGLESNVLPCVFLLALLCLVRARERPYLFVPAGAMFALCLYAYGTAYLAVPLFAVMALLYLLWTRPLPWVWVIAGAVAFALIATPIVATIVVNRFQLPTTRIFGLGIPRMTTVARFEQMSSLFGTEGLNRSWQNICSLWRILLTQEDGAPWNSISGYGIFYPTAFGFGLIGLVVFARGVTTTRSTELWMGLWLLAAGLLGAVQEPNINRVNLLWMPIAYLLARGINHIATDRWLTSAIVGGHLIMFGAFCDTYFNHYNANHGDAFFPGFGKAVQFAQKRVSGPICVTNRVNMPYAMVLFYDRTDPRVFARTAVYEGDGEFQGVKSFGRYTFGIDRCAPSTEAFILESGESDEIQARGTTALRSRKYLVITKN